MMPSDAYFDYLDTTKAFAFNPPIRIEENKLPQLPRNWLTRFEKLHPRFRGKLNKHIGLDSNYRFKDELINTLKPVYFLLTDGLTEQRFQLSKEEKDYALTELSEDIGECSGGFHIRLNHVMFKISKPQNMSQLLHTFREGLVIDFAMSLRAYVHSTNNISGLANTAGFGVRQLGSSNDINGKTPTEKDLESLKAFFHRRFQPYLLPQLLCNFCQVYLRGYYRGRLYDESYKTSEVKLSLKVIQNFLTKPLGNFTDYIITKKKLNPAGVPLTLILDINWTKIAILFYDELNAMGLYKTYPAPETPEERNLQTYNQLLKSNDLGESINNHIEMLLFEKNKASLIEYYTKLLEKCNRNHKIQMLRNKQLMQKVLEHTFTCFYRPLLNLIKQLPAKSLLQEALSIPANTSMLNFLHARILIRKDDDEERNAQDILETIFILHLAMQTPDEQLPPALFDQSPGDIIELIMDIYNFQPKFIQDTCLYWQQHIESAIMRTPESERNNLDYSPLFRIRLLHPHNFTAGSIPLNDNMETLFTLAKQTPLLANELLQIAHYHILLMRSEKTIEHNIKLLICLLHANLPFTEATVFNKFLAQMFNCFTDAIKSDERNLVLPPITSWFGFFKYLTEANIANPAHIALSALTTLQQNGQQVLSQTEYDSLKRLPLFGHSRLFFPFNRFRKKTPLQVALSAVKHSRSCELDFSH